MFERYCIPNKIVNGFERIETFMHREITILLEFNYDKFGLSVLILD